MRVTRSILSGITRALCAVACLAIAACQSAPRTRALSNLADSHAVAVPDLDGRMINPLSVGDHHAIVLLFISTDCPIANAYAPTIARLSEAYGPRGVAFYLVHVDPAVNADAARRHARDYRLTATVLLDHEHVLVRRAGVNVTPEAAVFLPDGSLAYRGRIDDRYVDFGQQRHQPTQHDLRDALEAMLAGRPIAAARVPAVGCYIPDPDYLSQ